jgi:hypothetical protein
MPRPKGSKNKKNIVKKGKKGKKLKKPFQAKYSTLLSYSPLIEDIYETIIEFMCPLRGLVRQKVKIKRYKKLGSNTQGGAAHTKSYSIVDREEEKDDGLSIYGEPEEDKE